MSERIPFDIDESTQVRLESEQVFANMAKYLPELDAVTGLPAEHMLNVIKKAQVSIWSEPHDPFLLILLLVYYTQKASYIIS